MYHHSPIPVSEFTNTTYEVRDHIGVITLNRPDRLNALNRRGYDEFECAFRTAAKDPDVRCLVITGAGRAFCAGEDVKEMMGAGPPRAPAVPVIQFEPTPAAMAAIEFDRPVIAAINGTAVGWGMEIALYADIRIASEAASFAELFIKRGLVCDVGGLWLLPAIVGPAKAAELLFSGDTINAQEALDIGLVTKVVPQDELLDCAMAYARRIAVNPPLALRYMKKGLRKTTFGDPREIGSWAIETIRKLYQTADHKEGVRSFLEKRPAVFTGN